MASFHARLAAKQNVALWPDVRQLLINYKSLPLASRGRAAWHFIAIRRATSRPI